MKLEITKIANEIIESELTIQDINLLDSNTIEALEFIKVYEQKDKYSKDAMKEQFEDATAVAVNGLNELIEHKNSLLDEENKVNEDIKHLQELIISKLDDGKEKLLKELDEVVRAIYDGIKKDESHLQSMKYMKLVQFANERFNITKKGIFEGLKSDNLKVNQSQEEYKPFWILNLDGDK